jgi:hypothetical protein
MNPAGFTRASHMFNDIWIARKNAMSLAKTLMVATMVITIGTQYVSSPPKITTARSSSSTNTTPLPDQMGAERPPRFPAQKIEAKRGIEPVSSPALRADAAPVGELLIRVAVL